MLATQFAGNGEQMRREFDKFGLFRAPRYRLPLLEVRNAMFEQGEELQSVTNERGSFSETAMIEPPLVLPY